MAGGLTSPPFNPTGNAIMTTNIENEFLLEMTGISKEFPGVKALDKVNLRVRPHSIHAQWARMGQVNQHY